VRVDGVRDINAPHTKYRSKKQVSATCQMLSLKQPRIEER
jgi:hypothetical protein